MVLNWLKNLASERPRVRLFRLFLLSVLGMLTACGSSAKPPEEEAAKPKKPKAAAEAAEGGAEGVVDGWLVLGENPKWKPIKPLFEAYAQREVTGLHNPTRANLVDFVEKPIIEGPIGGEPQPGPKAEPVNCQDPQKPQTLVRLGSLTLIMLVTGIAQPKAVVVDQDGKQMTLVPGDHVGTECGVVSAITQYELRISVPGEPEVVRSLAPPINPVEELDNENQAAKKPEL